MMTTDDEARDVPYFRNLIKTQSERLTVLCETWEAKLEAKSGTLTDEIVGQIRSTIGKARLFMFKKGRFEQFKGLVDNCEFGTGDKPTTCMDLQVDIKCLKVWFSKKYCNKIIDLDIT